MIQKHSRNWRKVWHRSHPALFFSISISLILCLGLGQFELIEHSIFAHQIFAHQIFASAQPSVSPPASAPPFPLAPPAPDSPTPSPSPTPAEAVNHNSVLPQAQPHGLPDFLANWQDSDDQGDYFSDIQLTPLGYLVWTEFPIKIYVEPAKIDPALGQVDQRSQQWYEAVLQGTQAWQQYVPLVEVDNPEQADITIWRIAPPLQVEAGHRRNFPGSNSPRGRMLPIPRARAAETRYEFFIAPAPEQAKLNPNHRGKLSHRFRILLTPNQTPTYTQATARHELGHALGIWGHSTSETDVMYFSQVRIPAAISPRDLNTLKRIYEQPTQLGWLIN